MSDTELDTLVEDFLNITLTETINSISNRTTMVSLTAAKEIAHTLRPFSGKSEHLEFFIASVDKFHKRYHDGTADESLKEFVFAAICAKLTDEAGDFILCRPDLKTWSEIKAALRLKFGDRVNRQVLLQQLTFLCRNKNESLLDFIERLKLLKSRILLKTIADDSISLATKEALNAQTELTTVTVLMSNCPIDLRTILMFRNPQNLEEANVIVVNHSLVEQQINARTYVPRQTQQPSSIQSKPVHQNNFRNLQQPNFSNPQMNFTRPQFNNFRENYQPQNPVSSFNNSAQQKPVWPSQPVQIQTKPVQQHFPTNKQVFGKPVNVFSKQNSHKPTEKPTPMSVSTRTGSKMSYNTVAPFQHYNAELTHIQDEQDNEVDFSTASSFDSNNDASTDTSNYYYNPGYNYNEEYHQANSPTEDGNFQETVQNNSPP